ncbi:MAG: ATP-binding protein [Bacteroidales bacterium]
MRYLNKVVFINSASISYSEINIDGNVHLIGTQGVGKSTALRAILFFYNADKQRLGISREKKSFDEYYFPYSNSYIVYEVTKEDSSFCVIAYRSQGRVAFRFIEGPYNQSNFIDENGKAYENWERIKEVIGKDLLYTRKVDRYEEYRDIIFGNNAALSPEFRRFALIESKQYKNIPRTIQNVFLNSKLDAEFIKQTIIMSIDEESIRIDLNSYMHHLEGFEGELSDVRKWTERDKNGELKLQNLANQVTEIASSIRFLEREKKLLAEELNFAIESTREKLPKIEKKLFDEQLEVEKKNRALGELEYKWKLKNDEFVSKAAIYTNKLQEAKKRETYYKSLQIDEVLSRVNRKNEYTTVLESLIKQKQVLLTRFDSINERFEAMEQQIKNQLQELINIRNEEKTARQTEFLQRKESILKQYTALDEEIKEKHRKHLSILQEEINHLNQETNTLRIKEAEIKHKRVFEAETERIKNEIIRNNQALNHAGNEIKHIENERNALKKDWAYQQEKLESATQHKQEILKQEINRISEETDAINLKLDSFKGSLYDWLNTEYPGWEETIGKIVDEEKILFSHGLNPKWTGNPENGLFGLQLDLSDVDRRVKTAADYQQELKIRTDLLTEKKEELKALTLELETKSNELKEAYLPKIKQLKEKLFELNYQIGQYTVQQDKLNLQLIETTERESSEKERDLSAVRASIDRISETKLRLNAELSQTEETLKKEVLKTAKERDKRIAEVEAECNNYLKETEAGLQIYRAEAKEKTDKLRNEQLAELAGKGIDTNQIDQLDKDIRQAKAELDFIEKHRDLVIEYRKDKKELFDLMDEFKAKQKQFRDQMEIEKEQQQNQRNKLKQEIKLIDNMIKTLTTEQTQLNENLREADQFRLTDCYASVKSITQHTESEKSCKIIVGLLNQNHFKGIERQTQLQEAVHRFTGNFSEKNVFKFRTNLVEQSEFMTFAQDLQEFMDEHKIEEYQNRLNQKYTDIITLIGRETSDLISKEGLIQRIIKDVNQDFIDRNFAGVIKSIAMRIVSSENRIVQLLMSIRDFSTDTLFDLGEANLFSSSDRERKNNQAIDLLKRLVKEITMSKEREIGLSDSFELQFRIVENDNDSGWVEKLSNIGSEGTDVLVKAMINIMLLNVFKEKASKRFSNFKLHCMMDEIGKLHPNNVKGILEFANSRNILLINGSPTSYNAVDYKYTYLLAKDNRSVTIIKRLIKKGA